MEGFQNVLQKKPDWLLTATGIFLTSTEKLSLSDDFMGNLN